MRGQRKKERKKERKKGVSIKPSYEIEYGKMFALRKKTPINIMQI